MQYFTFTKPHRCFVSALVAVCAFTLSDAQAATVTVGGGSSVDFADARVDFGCGDLLVEGSAGGSSATLFSLANLSLSAGSVFDPNASSISLGGDFANAGSFKPGSSQLSLVDACGNGKSQITGSTSFYDLSVTSNTGKQLILPAGATQNVAHSLSLQGLAGNLLQVMSSTAGVKARLILAAGAIQFVDYVNIRDNDASGSPTIAPGTPVAYHSINAGGLVNWFNARDNGGGGDIASVIPAPALGRGAALLLAALLAGLAWRHHRV
jgi:hypothetical protein